MKKIITNIGNVVTIDWENVWLISHDEDSESIILKTVYGANHTITCDNVKTASDLYEGLCKTFTEAKHQMEISK